MTIDKTMMDAETRRVIELAEAADLNPHFDEDGERGRNGVARLVINGIGQRALFGAIYINTRTGKVLYANLTHGNWGEEKRYTGVREVRDVIKSWLVVTA